ncbi:alpha/beta fold hydrolase [Intrasporangium flavum]|uniref:alpha/beta fold hydrolase n=1 Tax=Intrasporangium flavum TaxID=1428657 RepID=UPI001A95ABE1|nr:alpha/beta hydrolase [Intrasporangium flavum]
MRRAVAWAGSGAVAAATAAALCASGLWSDGVLRPVTDAAGRPVPGSLSEKTSVRVDGARLGMVVRGVDATNPVLLHLHGGMPEYFLAARHPTGLESVFTVAWLDRRGAGLSFDPRSPTRDVPLEQHVADALAVTDHLRERFGQDRIYLMAHSGGTFFGLQAAARAPERFHAYVGESQMVRQLESERIAHAYLVARYRELGDQRMVRRLEAAPVTTAGGTPPAYLRLRDTAMHRVGVGTTHDMRSVVTGVVGPSLTCREYTVGEKVRLWRGKLATGVMPGWQQVLRTDLCEAVPELGVPLYLLHGVHDYTCSIGLAREYLDRVRAPVKGFYTFERSAHSPVLEEPERARRILAEDVLRGVTRLADPVRGMTS